MFLVLCFAVYLCLASHRGVYHGAGGMGGCGGELSGDLQQLLTRFSQSELRDTTIPIREGVNGTQKMEV